MLVMLGAVDLNRDWKPSESKTAGHDKTEQPKVGNNMKQYKSTRSSPPARFSDLRQVGGFEDAAAGDARSAEVQPSPR